MHSEEEELTVYIFSMPQVMAGGGEDGVGIFKE